MGTEPLKELDPKSLLKRIYLVEFGMNDTPSGVGDGGKEN